LPLHGGAAGEQHQSRGRHVEPVHDECIGMPRLHKCAVRLSRPASPRPARQQAGGLVHDDDRFVDVQHIHRRTAVMPRSIGPAPPARAWGGRRQVDKKTLDARAGRSTLRAPFNPPQEAAMKTADTALLSACAR